MRVAFVSFKSPLDINSGAALEMRLVLERLSASGVTCASFSLNCYDAGDNYLWDEQIDKRLSPKVSKHEFFHLNVDQVDHYIFVGSSKDTKKLNQEDLNGFYRTGLGFIRDFKPNLILAFGSSELMPFLKEGRRYGARIVLYAGTAAYGLKDKDSFVFADQIIVPSGFIATLYEERFGRSCEVIPTSLPFGIEEVDDSVLDARYSLGFVTLINPEPGKGGHFFFKLAERYKLESRLFLCVESRSTRNWWENSGLKKERLESVIWAPWQADIRKILRSTAILAVPSLVQEAAGKVISEAMALGVPCVGFDVGGVKEQIATGGLVVPFDHRLAADSETGQFQTNIPEEPIKDWQSAFERVLRSPQAYREWARSANQEAERFVADRTCAQWLKTLKSCL